MIDLLSRAGSEPWSVVVEALAYEARGEALPDEVHEAVELAATVLAGAALVQAGFDIDAVEAKFRTSDYAIRLTYDPADDAVGLEVDWGEGELLAVRP